MEYTREIAAACASIGARLLDRYDPNWVDHIETERLDMSDGESCIIGQLYPSPEGDYYGAILAKFEGDPRWRDAVDVLAAEHSDLFEEMRYQGEFPDRFLGFNVPDPDDIDDYDIDEMNWFGWLDDAWQSEIRHRRDEAVFQKA